MNVIKFPGETRWPPAAANDDEISDRERLSMRIWRRFAELQPENARLLPWSLALCVFLIAVRIWG